MYQRTSLFLLLFFVASLGQFANGQTVTETDERVSTEAIDKRVTSLDKAVVELTESYDERNVLKITAWFNSEDVESLGGSDGFAYLVELGGSAAEDTSVKFGSPARVDLANGKWFGVVSFRMETHEKKFLKVVETCLVGISRDDGKTWSFKTGESFIKELNELVGTIPVFERTETEKVIEQ